MKNRFNFALPALLLLAIATQGWGQTSQNLVAGTGVINSAATWQGSSALNLISGTTLLPITSKTTALYIAFTAGSVVDIGKMVMYRTTGRNSLTIAGVTTVKYGGITNPTINLSDRAICPVQPVSLAHPCFVRLDTVKLKLSPLLDYYFVAYFPNSSNNAAVNSATSQFSTSTLTGGFDPKDDTKLKKGNAVPDVNDGHSYFLVGVMNN
ncbi:MAG: hypothetical protein HY010_06350 [Acidobacteria bacterium]|nr:hypothetical protein [Acidobacteriota bacterium]